MTMTDRRTKPFDLHNSIAALLESRSAGTAVAMALDDRYTDGETRARIAEGREREAQDRYDRKLASLFPAEFAETASQH